MHSESLNDVAILMLCALACGVFLIRLKQPAIVGYILAGVVLGPSGFGLVKDNAGIDLFAELGVLLLLFVLGMELSLQTFRRIMVLALACAALQSAVAIGLTFGAGQMLGWSVGQSLVFGFVLALSSTAVGIKMLEDLNEVRKPAGQTTIGVLIAQDLLVIPMLLISQSMGGHGSNALDPWMWVKLGGALIGLVALLTYLTRAGSIRLPGSQYLRGARDVAPLASLAFCFTFAAAASFLGLSESYGAFLAGLILGASTERRAALHFTHPIQNVLLMVFFLSIGLLIDLGFIWENLWTILLLVFVVLTAKSVANVLILIALGQPWYQAFLAGLVMAQIGEFSFVLAAAGLSAGVLEVMDYQLALSVVALSLMLSPLWLETARRLVALGDRRWTGVFDTAARLFPHAALAGERVAAGGRRVARRMGGRRQTSITPPQRGREAGQTDNAEDHADRPPD